MFECGEVCLNLSHQWTLRSGNIWETFDTTVYNLLVAIRDQVLNADPLFHQPGFVECGPSVVSEYISLLYNENVLINSLKIMMGVLKKPPKGLRAGLVVGGVGNKGCCCSHEFWEAVGSCIPELIDSFNKIGTNVDDYVTFLCAPTRVSLHGYISNTQ
ncbi:putative ubiquitin-conjugating enzyme/RWD [Helianthus debilis subsp. tardiflorus]